MLKEYYPLLIELSKGVIADDIQQFEFASLEKLQPLITYPLNSNNRLSLSIQSTGFKT